MSRASKPAPPMKPGPLDDAYRQRDALRKLQRANGINNIETGSDRSLGIFFMRLGIAEVHEQSVPHVSRNIAVVLPNGFGCHRLVSDQQFAVLLGIHRLG